MAERPIIFSDESVRAILTGYKTQTRRVIKLPRRAAFPDTSWIASINPTGGDDSWVLWGPDPVTDEFSRRAYPNGGGIKCPYGKPGDRLWVRERWCIGYEGTRDPYLYKENYEGGGNHDWQSPIFMPRHVSRITLEITDVRASRLQDISELDAKAEGAPRVSYRRGFIERWDRINSRRGFGWSTNPWVWALTFRVAEVRR